MGVQRRRTEVKEKLHDDVNSEHALVAELVEGETPNYEENGEEREADELDGLAADGVDGKYRHPVSGDGTSADEDGVTGSQVVELLVDC